MKNQTKILIGLGVAGTAAIAFFTLRKNKMEVPWYDKMTIDAYNPNSQIGNEIKTYHLSIGNPYADPYIKSNLDHHLSSEKSPNSIIRAAYQAKANWGVNEVVNY